MAWLSRGQIEATWRSRDMPRLVLRSSGLPEEWQQQGVYVVLITEAPAEKLPASCSNFKGGMDIFLVSYRETCPNTASPNPVLFKVARQTNLRRSASPPVGCCWQQSQARNARSKARPMLALTLFPEAASYWHQAKERSVRSFEPKATCEFPYFSDRH